MVNKILLVCFFLLSITFVFLGIRQIEDDKVLIPKIRHNVSQASESEISFSPLSVERIFQTDKSYISTISAEKIITLHVTGDVLPARTVNTRTLNHNDFTWAWKLTAEKLKQADLTYINLETPLTSDCKPTDSGMIFCGDARHSKGLVYAGVDIANLANNHTVNQGQDGLQETIELLTENNIETVGIPGKIPVKSIKGTRFAFLGYTDIEPLTGINKADEEVIKRDIEYARTLADVVIVQMHWGTEYQAQPDERQKYLARFIIDSGADLIIGNHPHWIQPIEIYMGKLITYAHGNFIFDQEWSQKTKEGVMGRYVFYGDQLIDVEFYPVFIQDFGQASWIEDQQHKNNILTDMKYQSELLESQSN